MNKIFFLLACVALSSVSVAKTTQKKSDADAAQLEKCYEQYPFFLEYLVLIPDAEFHDVTKAEAKMAEVKKQMTPDSLPEIQSCFDKIMSAARKEPNPKVVKEVGLRMGKIREAFNETAVTLSNKKARPSRFGMDKEI